MPAHGRLLLRRVFGSFAFVALVLSAVATALHFDPDVLRKAGLALLLVFGMLMIWPAAFERMCGKVGECRPCVAGDNGCGQTNLGGFVLGTTLGLIWTPCSGPVLGAILTAIATSPDHAHGALLLLTYTVGAALPDARPRLWRTGNLDKIAKPCTLRWATATGLWCRCHRVRAERFSAI